MKNLKFLRFLSSNLQLKIAIGTIIIVFIVVGSSTYFTIHTIENQMLKLIKQKLYETNEKIAESFSMLDESIHERNIKQLFTLIKTYPHHGVQVSFFNANDSLLMANSSNIERQIPLTIKSSNDTITRILKFTSDGDEYLVASRFIPNKPACYKCHGNKTAVLGAVQVSVSLSQTKEQISLISDMMIGNGLLSFLVMTIALSLMIRLLVSKPLIHLSDKMRQVEKGDLSIRLSGNRQDEIGVLTKSFNTMVERLADSLQRLEQTHQQELQHADRLATLGEMAAGLAHEIRNPLAGISGAIHVLTEEMNETNPNRKIMEEMQNEISRLNNTLSRFLTYSRPADPEFSEVDLHQVIESSLTLCMRSNQFSNIELKKDFQAGSEKIFLDPTLIQQVFINLILNAAQILGSNGTLTISTRKVRTAPDGQPALQIEFSDNGPGIPRHIIQDIFKPFFSTRPQGTGLGLAIVKHIILQHNGTIFVENKKEGGARFIITLPLKQDHVKNEKDA